MEDSSRFCKEAREFNAWTITTLRKKTGVGQREQVEAVGLSPQRLSDIERGNVTPPAGFERDVADAVELILRDRLVEFARIVG